MGDVQNRNSFGGQLVPKLKTIVFGLVAAVCFILIFLLNRKYPLCLDDWTYSLFMEKIRLKEYLPCRILSVPSTIIILCGEGGVLSILSHSGY